MNASAVTTYRKVISTTRFRKQSLTALYPSWDVVELSGALNPNAKAPPFESGLEGVDLLLSCWELLLKVQVHIPNNFILFFNRQVEGIGGWTRPAHRSALPSTSRRWRETGALRFGRETARSSNDCNQTNSWPFCPRRSTDTDDFYKKPLAQTHACWLIGVIPDWWVLLCFLERGDGWERCAKIDQERCAEPQEGVNFWSTWVNFLPNCVVCHTLMGTVIPTKKYPGTRMQRVLYRTRLSDIAQINQDVLLRFCGQASTCVLFTLGHGTRGRRVICYSWLCARHRCSLCENLW